MTLGEVDDWLKWHSAYDNPDSRLSRRLRVVQAQLRDAIDERPGKIRIVSMCAGQGRDVIGVLAGHPRKDDVEALLVELDPRNANIAEQAARDAGLDGVRVRRADASMTDSYADAVPAEIVLACGVFGNIPDAEVLRTVEHLPHFCAPGATVLWTRAYEPDRDIVGAICGRFEASGFEEVALDARGDETFRVGAHRLIGPALPFQAGQRLFTFVRGHLDAPEI